MNKTLNLKTLITVIAFSTLVGAISIDILICKSVINPRYYVHDDYLAGVFGALCTIAAVGNGILAIIVNALQSKMYGITFKELLVFGGSALDIKATVSDSLILVLISIPCYIFKFCNTITVALITVVLLILVTSAEVWDLIIRKDCFYKRIKQIITSRNETSTIRILFQNLYSGLEIAVKNKDDQEQEKCLDLINLALDRAQELDIELSPILQKGAYNLFLIAAKELGFTEAYSKIVLLGKKPKYYLNDTFQTTYLYFNAIQYCAENEIGSFNIPKNLEDILEEKDLPTFDKEYFCYKYFSYLSRNEIISAGIRRTLFENIIDKLCIDEKGSGDKTAENTILNIYKGFVLQNENKDDRQLIHTIIINKFYYLSRLRVPEVIISALSQMVRALYFYCNYEVETISVDYRESLEELFSYKETSGLQTTVSLAELIHDHVISNHILLWLVRDAVEKYNNPRNFDMFENFRNDSRAKSIVWTDRTLLRFSFIFFCSTSTSYLRFPIDDVIGQMKEEIEEATKERLYCDIVSYFDAVKAESTKGSSLTDEIKAEILKMQNLLFNRGGVPDSFIHANYEYFNNCIIEMKNTSIKNLTESTISDLLGRAKELMVGLFANETEFEFDTDLSLNYGQTFKMPLYFVNEARLSERMLADDLERAIQQVINFLLAERLDSVLVNYDNSDIPVLLDKLRSEKYYFRNYTYINDLAISKETRDTNDFKELENIIKKMPYTRMDWLEPRIFMKVEKIQANIDFSPDILVKPNSMECEEYLQNYRIADGKYKLDSAVRNLKDSIEYLKNNYWIQSIILKIATNITPESGFQVVS